MHFDLISRGANYL